MRALVLWMVIGLLAASCAKSRRAPTQVLEVDRPGHDEQKDAPLDRADASNAPMRPEPEQGQEPELDEELDPEPQVVPRGECDEAADFEPLIATEEETCYEFRAHELSDPSDTTEFIVLNGESYNQLYYTVPWPADTVATRIGMVLDNEEVLMHWWMFGLGAGAFPNGTVEHNATGSTMGQEAQVVGAWSVGGCNVEMPADIGLRLPDPDKSLMIQWHHLADSNQTDGSVIQVCTVPKASRTHTAGITLLGEESPGRRDGIPEGPYSVEGLCGNTTASPITIFAAMPHMYRIGSSAALEIMRPSAVETVLDVPFEFEQHAHYAIEPRVDVAPGEALRATCRYLNDTSNRVISGQSVYTEICINFVFSYPAGALDEAASPSLLGATNTCFDF